MDYVTSAERTDENQAIRLPGKDLLLLAKAAQRWPLMTACGQKSGRYGDKRGFGHIIPA